MRRGPRFLLGVGAVLVLAAGVGIAYPYWWGYRSASAGQSLLAKSEADTTTTLAGSTPSSTSDPTTSPATTSPATTGTATTSPVTTTEHGPVVPDTDAASTATVAPARADSSGGSDAGSTSSPSSGPNASGCSAQYSADAAPPGSSPGLLTVPSLSLSVPVLEGLGDSVLDVAAGHDPDTPWPGAPGEAVVLAHDVSYFADLDHLAVGAQVTWSTPCLDARFTVTGTQILSPGATLSPPSSGIGLALVTCYPTNALFWTSERFVVFTSLVSESVGSEEVAGAAPSLDHIDVPAPPDLVAEGLDLSSNYLPLGSLYLTGSPASSWSSSPNPLIVEAAALEVFFGVEKAIEQQNATWWADLAAPGLTLPSHFPTFGTSNVSIDVDGTTPRSVTISSGSASATVTIVNGVAHLTELVA